MPWFRPPPATTSPLRADAVRGLCAEALRPAHFLVAPTLALEWAEPAREEVVWEVFQGRLLAPAHSRQRRAFESWGIYQTVEGARAPEPLLSLKLDLAAGELHVVRGLDSYVWEGHAEGNVIHGRERRAWARELVATLSLERFASSEELLDEVVCRLFQAVAGTRLPLSSLEAPLPAFSFGELFYCYRGPDAEGGPLRSPVDLARQALTPALSPRERAKLLEAALRLAGEADLPALPALFAGHDLAALLRTLFNEVSLSPYTDFADRTLLFLAVAEGQGALSADQAVDFLAHLLRQLGRHLTAYDLMLFHHRGANYPDALLLDAVLADYLKRVEARPELFLDSAGEGGEVRARKRLRRRGLRQGWLLRRRYEGHPVPDLPTSPGENARVLPPSHPRVPEEQLLQPGRRRRRLYAGAPRGPGPRAAEVLRASAADLAHEAERLELGAALFLDRPFGGGKAPAEPDATLLLASLAYSRSVAEQRLAALARDVGLSAEEVERVQAGLALPGLPLDAVGPAVKPATVSLADARRAAADFVLVRTMPGSIRALMEQFCFDPVAGLWDNYGPLVYGRALVARSAAGNNLIVYDERWQPRLELEVVMEEGYASRAGEEWPVGGLRVVGARGVDASKTDWHDLRAQGLVLLQREQGQGYRIEPHAG